MRVVFYPVGNETRASSRYRVHNVVEARSDFVIGKKDNWHNADALVFQRITTRANLAAEAKRKGKLIVFDCSDAYFHRHKWKRSWPGVKQMAGIAHVLTTSNKDDAALMRELFKKRVHVIPCAQKQSKHRRKHQNVRVPTVVWLGRENTMDKTLGTIWDTLQQLSREGIPFKVLLINDTGNTHGLVLGGGFSSVHGHFIVNEVVGMKWSLGKVYPTLAKCDIGICPQIKQPNGRYHKDENKAYTCWICGVPCVSFARTKNWYEDLKLLLTDWKVRERQGKRAITRAKEVAPSKVADTWARVIKKELARLK